MNDRAAPPTRAETRTPGAGFDDDGFDEDVGPAMFGLVEELYPICRSITGNGVRRTLDIVAKHLARPSPAHGQGHAHAQGDPLAGPLTSPLAGPLVLGIREVPSGAPVLDWTVPKEWNIEDAWIADASGKRVVDFRASNLHVVNYSVPVRARMSLAELRPHLFSLPGKPDLIPYRTSYYDEAWGFCLTHRQLESLPEGEYEVCIDATLEPGSLTYGELVLPGTTEDEILISTHVCHPSLCDDNLTGIAISVFLARALSRGPARRPTLRFLYAPGTIGAITWLAQNRERAARIKHGLTLTCLGDASLFTYKRTVEGDAEIDRAAAHVLATSGLAHQVIDFFPYGYDERQYNSPGFRIPVGSLMRGRHGQFPEYHTSGDNLTFVAADRMVESLRVLHGIVGALAGNASYVNKAPYGEPQLGKRGLYRAMGGTNIPDLQLALLWVLNLSDGRHSLLTIAERAKMDFGAIRAAADLLLAHDLLE
jgi:aminopeptidase-like protein